MRTFEIERCQSGNLPFKLFHVTRNGAKARVFLSAFKAWNYYYTGDPNKYSRKG